MALFGYNNWKPYIKKSEPKVDKKSLLRGISSVLNLFPRGRASEISIPSHSDNEAFKKDLEQVGNDMFFAINSLPHNEKKKIKA